MAELYDNWESYWVGIKKMVIGRFQIPHPDNEDLVSDIFLSCLESLSQYKGDCALKTWIYRISIRKVIDYMRVKYRRTFVSLEDWPEMVSIGISANTTYFFDEVVAGLMADGCYHTVPRRLVGAMMVGDYTREEMAEVMGCSKGNVTAIKGRIVKSVRLLAEGYDG